MISTPDLKSDAHFENVRLHLSQHHTQVVTCNENNTDHNCKLVMQCTCTIVPKKNNEGRIKFNCNCCDFIICNRNKFRYQVQLVGINFSLPLILLILHCPCGPDCCVLFFYSDPPTHWRPMSSLAVLIDVSHPSCSGLLIVVLFPFSINNVIILNQ